jgi:iron only hydrogenase large subunit-like protein
VICINQFFYLMFTGTVKLAQIDDYISPGQNCIQPKIMKEGVQPEKATVTLNDCLACSGCITSAESVLIEQMSINKLL